VTGDASTITVGVATCGRPDALRRCLGALAEQARAVDQVVVVDQAPSAEARAAVAESGLRAARYVEQARLGLSASRNLALRLAGSRLLAVTDDDCAPDPGWLEAVAGAFDRPPRPGAVTGPILPLGEAPPDGYAISLRVTTEPIDHRGRIQPWGVGSGGNFAAPVELLGGHGGWDERLGAGSGGLAAEDADLIYRLLRAGEIVRYEPAAVVRHAWQTRERRLATRWSYGYGIGAMCGLTLARRDLFAARMLAGYARQHVRPLAAGLLRRRRGAVAEHGRALASVGPGLVYGLRAASRPPRTPPARGV
jgi:glycosyltransferase involved in cell wall biosynthesis